MAEQLNPEQSRLFADKNFGVVTTLNRDGSPQSTVVWVDTEGGDVLFNTALGRIKANNLERDPRISITVFDPAEPYQRFVTVRGRAELVDEGAMAHINSLAKKYLGKDEYPFLREGEQRVIVRIKPEKVARAG